MKKKLKDCPAVRDGAQRHFVAALLAMTFIVGSVSSQSRQMDAAELQLAVNKLSVLGSVLFVAAHPDDENTALLSYFAKGKLYRTAYLSITRGEGGQNIIGPEQGAELGVIRTQELLAARRIDGAEQFFTRAIDFGYSKSSDEALQLWNKDSVLKDVVWVIRKFRPDIIITRFSPTQGGHGHHLASAILAEEAFNISGDANIFPEQLQYVQPWKAKRLLFNHFRFGGVNSNPNNTPTIKVDVGEYSPLLGKSFTEIAGISRTMHKSQAMGSPQNKGSNINEFVVIGGEPAKNDLHEGIDVSWSRMTDGKKIQRSILEIRKKFSIERPEKIIPAIVQLYKTLLAIPGDPWVEIKKNEVVQLIQSCAGLWIDVTANDFIGTPGGEIKCTAQLVNRSDIPMEVKKLALPALHRDSVMSVKLEKNRPYQITVAENIPSGALFSQPYWLAEKPIGSLYTVRDLQIIGIAESHPSLWADVTLQIEKEQITFRLPVRCKWIDDVAGEQYRTVEIVPDISVQMQERNLVFTSDSISKSVTVTLRANRDNAEGSLSLQIPDGWKSSPAEQKFSLKKKSDEAVFRFSLTPSHFAGSGKFSAAAVVDSGTYSSTVRTISYPHIPVQTVLIPSEWKLLKLDLKTQGKTIGYIMGAGDEIPKALEQMGYAVTMISDGDLHSSDLSKYDAIVAGVRAYNTRPELRTTHGRMMQYVENGGTYIVQYQTAAQGETDNIAPYVLNVSRDRVTDEHAEMTFLLPDHPLLNIPNRLSQKDFDGWIQERGLYFADKWDKRFEAILACNDPNEQPKQGGLLYARHGKGHYIYCGYALFRQLPAGVEGAYRLFANLVSVGK